MQERTMQVLVSCLAAVALIAGTQGYSFFREEIPNGFSVPHPCTNSTWNGVGHESSLGGGDRNPFGLDFYQNGKTWDRTLCEKDSDGDGKTNGEELGDPDCVWTRGDTPSRPALSHPGICDPFPSSICQKPDFVSCEAVGACPGINDAATFSRTYRFPPTPVPAQETTYMCMGFELPSDQELHFFATTPYIDTPDVLHHILIYGCTVDSADKLKNPLNTPYRCGMSGDPNCQTLVDTWAVGSPGTCSHPDVGFRVGGAQGIRFATMEVHWDNRYLRNDFVDSSGITLYFTPNLRTHDATIFMIGQNYLEIPPNVYWHEESSTCTSQCMSKSFSGPVYATEVFNHMHYLGTQQRTSLHRDGEKLQDLAFDEHYHFEYPVKNTLQEPVMIKPTDELKTSCYFQSRSREKTTFYGEGSQDEMCFAFLTVYPAANVKQPSCVAWRGVDYCDLDDGVVGGCNFTAFGQEAIVIGGKLFENCDITGTSCRAECKQVVREVSKHPCLKGDVGLLMKRFGDRQADTPESELQNYQFYSALRSCDVELALENNSKAVGGASTTIPSIFALALSVFQTYLLTR